MSDRAIHPNTDTCTVEAGAGADLFALRGSACVQIELHADGTLVYTTIRDVVRTETMKAGLKTLQAKAIGAGTSVRVSCFFNK